MTHTFNDTNIACHEELYPETKLLWDSL